MSKLHFPIQIILTSVISTLAMCFLIEHGLPAIPTLLGTCMISSYILVWR